MNWRQILYARSHNDRKIYGFQMITTSTKIVARCDRCSVYGNRMLSNRCDRCHLCDCDRRGRKICISAIVATAIAEIEKFVSLRSLRSQSPPSGDPCDGCDHLETIERKDRSDRCVAIATILVIVAIIRKPGFRQSSVESRKRWRESQMRGKLKFSNARSVKKKKEGIRK